MDDDRDAILKRRKRLMALALSGMTAAAALSGCETTPQPCLRPAYDAGQDAGPQVCLSIAEDAGDGDGGG